VSADGGYWAVIKANVAGSGSEREAALNEWWSTEHVPEYVALDGFRHGWRVRSLEASGQIGKSYHRYYAVYAVDAVSDFNAALDMGTKSHPGRPWGPWQEYVDEYVIDWERTYYRILHREGPDGAAGGYWAIVRANVDLADDDQERAFDEWYSTKHMPEICSYDGIYRGWRLEVQPDENDLGPRRQRFWGVYQLDDPSSFAEARADRARRGIQPWDGIWMPYVRDFEITFHEVLYEIGRPAALASASARR
jgi:hypothetical protein